MKVKIEFTNGNIEATEVMGVTIYQEQGIVFTTCANSRHNSIVNWKRYLELQQTTKLSTILWVEKKDIKRRKRKKTKKTSRNIASVSNNVYSNGKRKPNR